MCVCVTFSRVAKIQLLLLEGWSPSVETNILNTKTYMLLILSRHSNKVVIIMKVFCLAPVMRQVEGQVQGEDLILGGSDAYHAQAPWQVRVFFNERWVVR